MRYIGGGVGHSESAGRHRAQDNPIEDEFEDLDEEMPEVEETLSCDTLNSLATLEDEITVVDNEDELEDNNGELLSDDGEPDAGDDDDGYGTP